MVKDGNFVTLSNAFTAWGQFIIHDILKTPVLDSKSIKNMWSNFQKNCKCDYFKNALNSKQMLYKQETIIVVTISQIVPVLNRRTLPRTTGNFFVIKFRPEINMIWTKIIFFLYSGKESVNVYQWPDHNLSSLKITKIMMSSSENRNRLY